MLKVLGLDYGKKHIGLAVSSEDNQHAFARDTLDNNGAQLLFEKLKQFCQEEGIGLIVLGLPLNQHGQIGKSAGEIKDFGARLGNYLQIPVEYEDERFSSAYAAQLFKQSGRKARQVKDKMDQKSAQIILQTYLDRKNVKSSGY